MKTRKYEIKTTAPLSFGSAQKQKSESSILRFALLTKTGAGILPAFVALVLPSFASEAIFSNTAVALPTDNAQLPTEQGVEVDRAGEAGETD
ncbi:MAG: hypothetical protein SAK29_27820, partial [Scytonema sp. PMC 1069.18]|nr:hypothetical protein [Scytonema sp. PMC 1069.18]